MCDTALVGKKKGGFKGTAGDSGSINRTLGRPSAALHLPCEWHAAAPALFLALWKPLVTVQHKENMHKKASAPEVNVWIKARAQKIH